MEDRLLPALLRKGLSGVNPLLKREQLGTKGRCRFGERSVARPDMGKQVAANARNQPRRQMGKPSGTDGTFCCFELPDQ